MDYKKGDICEITDRTGCTNFEETEGSVYIRITNEWYPSYKYEILDKKFNVLKNCVGCFKDGHLKLYKPNNKTIMQKLTPMLKRFLDKGAQTLYKADYINGDLELTDEGKSALNTVLYEGYGDLLFTLCAFIKVLHR